MKFLGRAPRPPSVLFDASTDGPRFTITLQNPTLLEKQAALSSFDLEEEDEGELDAIPLTPLDADSLSALLSRLPDSQHQDDGTDDELGDSDFRVHRRDAAIAPPLKSGTLPPVPFPPPPEERPEQPIDLSSLPKVTAAQNEQRSPPLTISVTPPNDVVDHALSSISLTFSQSMVALSNISQMESDIAALAISLTPHVDGAWKWLGNQTLQFNAKHRFPFSTEFVLSVGEDCKSYAGGKLSSPFVHSFRTLPPRVVHWEPSGTAKSLSPLFLLCFDQRISSASIFSHIYLAQEEDGARFASEEFESVDEAVAKKEWPDIIEDRAEGTWAAFKLRDKVLEKATSYRICVPSGCPSAEGSLTSEEDWSGSFSTYGPLVVLSSYGSAFGLTQWHIQFSNELDHKSISKSALHISPSIEDFKVSHTEGDSFINVKPIKPGAARRYVVALDTSITDVYGQHLDDSASTIEFQTPENVYLEGCLWSPSSMVVLNPSTIQNPFISLSVRNFSSLHIQVFQVQVDDYNTFLDLLSSTDSNHSDQKTLGKKVYDEEVELQAEIDETCAHTITLGSLLQHPNEHYGQLVVVAKPTERARRQHQGLSRSFFSRDVVHVWVQCTELTVDVFPDPVNGIYTAWVSSLATGAAISKAIVRVGNHTEETDDDGLALVTTEHFKDSDVIDTEKKRETISVQKGKDVTFLPDISMHDVNMDRDAWYVFDSRGLYKPTEEVQIKGYIRKLKRKKDGGQQPFFPIGHVSYSVSDARENKLAEGDTTLNEYGSFFFTFSIPDNANLGVASVRLDYKEEGGSVQHQTHLHTLKIEEFRKPEFEVKTTHRAVSAIYSHASRSNFVIASTAVDYFAGGPVVGGNVSWIIESSQTGYNPPGHVQYTFGRSNAFFPRYWGWERDSAVLYPSSELKGKLGMDGKHHVKIQFEGIEEHPSSIAVSATACVTDINNQSQSAATSIIIHPCLFFVGFKLKQLFGRQGEEVKGEVIVCDVDGKVIDGVQVKVMVKGIGKKEEDDDAGLSVHRDVSDDQDFSVSTGEKPAEFSFFPKLGGVYSAVFKVNDSEDRFNESSYNGFFVSGASIPASPWATSDFVRQEEAQIFPSKSMYEPEETAVLLIQSPFWPAEGLLIVKHGDEHVGQKVRFHMPGSTHTVTTCLGASWVPSVEVQLLLVGSTEYSSSKKGATDPTCVMSPAFAAAKTSLKISCSSHCLAVQITPMRANETATPGGEVHVSVKVLKENGQDASGNTEVSLVVVDEAIVNLAGYTLSDPLSFFYPEQLGHSFPFHLREKCLMPDYNLKQETMRGFGACVPEMAKMQMFCAMGAHAPPTVRIRSDFNPLAAFVPHCVTDGQGCVEVKVQLPDNLTRYRIWAVAATETQFGLAESSLIVQLPVMLRPSPPRFLNLSDKAFVSMILQNQTNSALPLLVGMTRKNEKLEAKNVGYSLTLPSCRRLVVAFPVLALDVGKSHLQVVVCTPESHDKKACFFSDASDIIIPIFTPAVSENFTMHGNVANEEVVVQPIKSPLDAFPGYGGLDVAIASTTLQSLTDALLYLHSYPFECNEQLASRVIGFLGLWEVLEAFKVKELPSKEKMEGKLKQDLQSLKGRQLDCGGWSWWTSDGNPRDQPFISLHAAWAVVKASKLEVLGVDKEMLEKALGYCAGIEGRLSDGSQCSTCQQEETKYALSAYAMYILAMSGKDVGEEASDLLRRASLGKLSLEACGWILIALGLAQKDKSNEMNVLLNHVKSRVIETGEHAHFTTSYQDDGFSVMLHSNSRTDAILLEALLYTEPSSILCAKLAKGLQACRKAGKWNSTQENCFALTALNKFFAVYEKAEPNFLANVWLGEEGVVSHKFSGRTLETKQAKVPMPFLLSKTQAKGVTQLVLEKKGEGRLYFRIGLEYTPRGLIQDAASYGFVVRRVFEGVDDSLHAVQDQSTKVWIFRAGEKIRVKLTLGTALIRHHVALVDYIPAGCEPINPALERLVKKNQMSCTELDLWRSCWVDHVNIRDERVEVFCTVLRPGCYEYSYIMRATCSGEFIVPPTKAEEMYNPENYGRCASEKCRIN